LSVCPFKQGPVLPAKIEISKGDDFVGASITTEARAAAPQAGEIGCGFGFNRAGRAQQVP